MDYIPKNDFEAIDFILQEAYLKNKWPAYISEEAVDVFFDKSYGYDAKRIFRKMVGLGLVEKSPKFNSIYVVSDKAIEILNEYSSYSNFVLSEKRIKVKGDKKIAFDRFVTNGNVLVTLVLGFLTLALSQLPILCNKGPQTTEQGILLLSKKLDSLRQDLQKKQMQTNTPVIKDTAVNHK